MRNNRQDDVQQRPGAGALLLNPLDGSGVRIPKLVGYVAMFTALSLIDFRYLKTFLDPAYAGPVTLDLAVIAKFVLLTAWPFAAMAVVDDRWTSGDGARIAIAAFIAPAAFWFSTCGVSCLGTVATLFLPFVASAAVGHAAGAWHRPRDLEA